MMARLDDILVTAKFTIPDVVASPRTHLGSKVRLQMILPSSNFF